jgi:hypothetical protein
MCRWCSQITNDYTECSFNPSRLVSAPPPPQLLPLFSYLSLITVLVNPAHGTQGCFNTTSFDNNYWHFNSSINLFCSSFSPLLHTRTFFAIPLAKKMHPFFSAYHQSENPFFGFLLCYNFCPSLINMPITYIEEIETSLVTLFGRVPGFMEGKGR